MCYAMFHAIMIVYARRARRGAGRHVGHHGGGERSRAEDPLVAELVAWDRVVSINTIQRY